MKNKDVWLSVKNWSNWKFKWSVREKRSCKLQRLLCLWMWKKITEAERLLRVLEEIKGPGVLGLTGDGAVDMAIREGVIWNDQMGWCHSGA